MLKKSLSQHLMKDKNLIDKMVRLAGIGKDDVVLEIGAGQGDLTRCLAERAGHVFAVELDQCFGEYLLTLEGRYGNVRVVFGDFLSLSLDQFRGRKDIKVVGNIPYKITGPIVMKVLEERGVVETAHFTMQKEIAQRIVSRTRHRTYGALSVICQLLSDVKILFYIKPGVFLPPPKVESAFLQLIPRKNKPDMGREMIDFVRLCFRHKRKHLRHSLLERFTETQIASLYSSMGFSGTVRAEEIEPEGFETMYDLLNKDLTVGAAAPEAGDTGGRSG
jgi:16S rRNA (adenine1518-N6/adenine1519-N6)-dimethyltransferase